MWKLGKSFRKADPSTRQKTAVGFDGPSGSRAGHDCERFRWPKPQRAQQGHNGQRILGPQWRCPASNRPVLSNREPMNAHSSRRSVVRPSSALRRFSSIRRPWIVLRETSKAKIWQSDGFRAFNPRAGIMTPKGTETTKFLCEKNRSGDLQESLLDTASGTSTSLGCSPLSKSTHWIWYTAIGYLHYQHQEHQNAFSIRNILLRDCSKLDWH